MGLRRLTDPRLALPLLLLAGLALVPAWTAVTGQTFALSLATRVVILTLAAASLNLILGYGGMVSFGHAAYIGIGGYTVAILAYQGVTEAWIQWPIALGLSAATAAVIGALSLRTKGIFFIMITLAFAQMVYYVGVGLYDYGGDDGLNLVARSALPPLDLNDRAQLYLLSLAVLCIAFYLQHRLIGSRFGMALRGAKSNESRMRAIGFPTFRYRLTAFVISGTVCGLAGILLVNHSDFISPALMHWTRSGDLIVTVVLGGMGALFGPLYGTLGYLLLEESLSSINEHWKIVFGPFLLIVALYARGGIAGLIDRFAKQKDDAR